MLIFKCKMCGGTIEFAEGSTVGVCDSCGTKQTLPRLDDEKRINLYDRANHFRRNNDYDKAMSIYEQILNEDGKDPEAYWSIVLCKYGIEYVEDPASNKRVPTVNRAQFTSIYMDEDYKSALQYADELQRKIYEEEAKAIDEIQKGILEISKKEEPFDIFICYKETDESGRRTQDSVLANDLYHQLTQEGFKVFFSRITLEDKLGVAYEPYIFAALNSAKVMVVLGTKPEYFNAVWVKNEWSRYLALIKNGAQKMLIPAYRDMDPYDLPEEFSHLQAQDMSKLGFMQDLIRGIKKIIGLDMSKEARREAIAVNANTANIESLLKRVNLFLEDGKWQDASIYCEKVLDIDPMNAEAYLGKLMAELQVRTRKQLADYSEPFDDRDNYNKVIRFSDEKLESEMRGYIKNINDRKEKERITEIYNKAKQAMNTANSEKECKAAADMFATILGFKDVNEQIDLCKEKIENIKEKKSLEEELRQGKKKKVLFIVSSIIVVCIIFTIIYMKVIIPNMMKDLKKAEVGDYVLFGSYEQDNDVSNGKEDIEWIVLAKDNGRILVISKYLLDSAPYNYDFIGMTWESCSLRNWLNGTFFNEAFNMEEGGKIANVQSSSKVFLLSIDEAEKYFKSDKKRMGVLTELAKWHAFRGDDEVAFDEDRDLWWLRQSEKDSFAYMVEEDGSISDVPVPVTCESVGVRPAMWISIDDMERS